MKRKLRRKKLIMNDKLDDNDTLSKQTKIELNNLYKIYLKQESEENKQ